MTAATVIASAEPRAAFDRISLRRLVLIRWVAVAGQAVTLLLVHFVFGFRLPLPAALAVVGCSVLLNVFFVFHRRGASRLGEREAAFYLGYDTLQLAVLLYLTGGLQNPFAILIVAPVTVAATVLSRRPVIALALLAVGGDHRARGLWHVPLPWRDHAAGASRRSDLRHLGGAGARDGVHRPAIRWSVARGGAADARRGRRDPAGAGARAARLGGRRARRGGGARARQPARDDRGRRQGAGARPAGRSPHAEDAALLLSQ